MLRYEVLNIVTFHKRGAHIGSATERRKPPWDVTKQEYKIEPSLTLTLEGGTLYVLILGMTRIIVMRLGSSVTSLPEVLMFDVLMYSGGCRGSIYSMYIGQEASGMPQLRVRALVGNM